MIVGAQKCGTTTLFNWLGQHPDVICSDPKEPQFFEAEYHRGLNFYSTYFPGYDSRLSSMMTLEARVFNFVIGYVPYRIHESIPDTKIIVLLRDPVRRAFSAWSAFNRMRIGREKYDFIDSMREGMTNSRVDRFHWEGAYIPNRDPKGGTYENIHVETGLYIAHLQRYGSMFRHLYVDTLERMQSDPIGFYEDTCFFLGLRKRELFGRSAHNMAPEQIDVYDKYPATAEALKVFYRDSIHGLSEWLERDLVAEWGYR
jgi:hypothetical protein